MGNTSTVTRFGFFRVISGDNSVSLRICKQEESLIRSESFNFSYKFDQYPKNNIIISY